MTGSCDFEELLLLEVEDPMDELMDEVPDLEISISFCTAIMKTEARMITPSALPKNQPAFLVLRGFRAPTP